MLFSSWNFLVYFLPSAVLGFYLIPTAWEFVRKAWLIAASFVFYGCWKLEYVPLLAGSILVNFAVAEAIVRCHRKRPSTFLLTGGIATNLILLGYFKYTNFAVHFLGFLTHRDLGQFNIILPLAISFFTFTQISYLVDVYRDRHVHYRFLDYSLFVSFFPHLIAGPIVRHWEIIPQFAQASFRVNRDNFGIGMTLFLFGLFKKFYADSATLYADTVYDGAAAGLALSSFEAWVGTICFALQIYFDFSSYSDMAIGLARMFGVKFPYNFDSPYRASSIIAFWERWHRTLTRFLREYVYFSLGGNRRGYLRQNVNIMATMLLSGLWHGAGWTFILWGAIHGTYIVANHLGRLGLEKMNWTLKHVGWRMAGVVLTFGLVTLAWTLFRAPSLPVAGRVLGPMLGIGGFSFPQQWVNPSKHAGHFLSSLGCRFIHTDALQFKHYDSALETIGILLLICWAFPNTQQLLYRYQPILEPVPRPPRLQIRLGFWTGIVLGFLAYLILRNSYVSEPSPFIYFNF